MLTELTIPSSRPGLMCTKSSKILVTTSSVDGLLAQVSVDLHSEVAFLGKIP